MIINLLKVKKVKNHIIRNLVQVTKVKDHMVHKVLIK